MGFAEGVAWSILGAVAHSAIDVLRKCAAQRLPPTDLIALLTLYNAFFAIIGVWLIDGRIPAMSEMPNFPLFCKVAVATATMGLTAAVLYQRALSIAPLSLTVPYLAFAPVFVVFVSPLFLVGEVPSGMGLCGVAVVSLAGYKLGVLGAADAAALNQQGGKPAKIKAPLLPVGANGVGAAAGSKLMAHQHDEHEVQHLIPAADVRSRMGELSHTGQQLQQQHSRVYQRQPAQLLSTGTAAASAAGAGAVASSPGLHTTNSSRIGTQQAVLQQRQQSPEHAQGNHLQEGQLLHHPQAQDGSIAGGADARGGSSGGSNKTKSAWAIAYYKQKSPPVGVWEAACGGLQSAAKQLLSTTGANSPRGRGPAGGAAQGLFAAGSPNGHHHHHHHSGNGLLSSTDSSGGTAGNSNGSSNNSWEEDSQAKAGKDLKLEVLSKRGGALPAGQRGGSSSSSGWVVRRWLPWLHAPLQRLRRSMHGTAQLLSGPSAGPTLVLIVAFLYSLTASVDKLGMSASSSTAFYLCVQRVLIGAASLLYLLVSSPRTLRHLYKDAVLLVTLSLVEQASIVLYFKAIQNILVSYMVAIKRLSVLLSTLVGCVMFKERIGRRMPYILLMLLGMLLIVLQPGHEALHHSHHTRR